MKKTFALGEIVITRNAMNIIGIYDISTALKRHSERDWGDICHEDKRSNDAAIHNNSRIMSVYRTLTEMKFWIITEADRSATTILLPEDY